MDGLPAADHAQGLGGLETDPVVSAGEGLREERLRLRRFQRAQGKEDGVAEVLIGLAVPVHLFIGIEDVRPRTVHFRQSHDHPGPHPSVLARIPEHAKHGIRMSFVSGSAHGAECVEAVVKSACSIPGHGEVGGAVPRDIGNRRDEGKDEQNAQQGDDELSKSHGPSFCGADRLRSVGRRGLGTREECRPAHPAYTNPPPSAK